MPERNGRWNEWDEFIESTNEAGFMQTSWWAQFRTCAGYEHFGIVLRSAGSIVGGAIVHKFPWSETQSFYYMPEGPVLRGEESLQSAIFQAILEEIDRVRSRESATISHLRMEPRRTSLPFPMQGFRRVPPFSDRYMEPRDTLVVNLEPGMDHVLAQMKPKGRYNIRVAQKHGVTIVKDSSERGITDFLDVYSETAERQGLNAKPDEYFMDMLPLILSGRGQIFFAEYRNIRVAGAIVLHCGKRATYFFGGSLSEHRHVMAPYVLHYEIMCDAYRSGHSAYDLWGIAPAGEQNHPWESITAFKRKFGGVELNFIRAHDLVFDDTAYEEYREAEGRSAAPEDPEFAPASSAADRE